MMFAAMSDNKYFSRFDFAKGYCQSPMVSKSHLLIAFSTESGRYRFKYMPFAITTASAVFTKLK